MCTQTLTYRVFDNQSLTATRDVIWGLRWAFVGENEKLYYVCVLSNTAKKMTKKLLMILVV